MFAANRTPSVMIPIIVKMMENLMMRCFMRFQSALPRASARFLCFANNNLCGSALANSDCASRAFLRRVNACASASASSRPNVVKVDVSPNGLCPAALTACSRNLGRREHGGEGMMREHTRVHPSTHTRYTYVISDNTHLPLVSWRRECGAS